MSEETIHRFTLVLADRIDLDELEKRVFETGCDDALLGARDGAAYLDFDRKHASFAEALDSAIKDVQSAGLKIRRVEPDDIVNQSQMAERAGRTRESIRLLISGERGPDSFPPPISSVKTKTRLWRWSRVAAWMARHSMIDEEMSAWARRIAAVNEELDRWNGLAPKHDVASHSVMMTLYSFTSLSETIVEAQLEDSSASQACSRRL